jgi:rubrerythrin
MHPMTEENLKNAFAGESQAHMKYQIFAEKAEQEGFNNIARLFRAISYAELVHAKNHLNALNGVGQTPENLDVAIAGENFEVEEMYPAYKVVAEQQNEKSAVQSMHFALEAEKIHAALYTEAKQATQGGKDMDIRDIYICPVCGYTAIGDIPDRCPVCKVMKDTFKKY